MIDTGKISKTIDCLDNFVRFEEKPQEQRNNYLDTSQHFVQESSER